MKCACVCMLLWLLCAGLQAQDLIERSSAAAGAWSHNFLNPEAALINPAAIPAEAQLVLRLVTIRPYMIPGLSASSISAQSIIMKDFSIAAGINNFANPDFRAIKFYLASGRKLGEDYSVGISIDVANSKVRGYAGLKNYRALASAARNKNALQTAISVFFESSETESRNFYPGVIAGIGKEWSPSFYTDLALMISAKKHVINTSLQYIAIAKLIIAIRVISGPMRLDFESGWIYQKLRLSVLGAWHPQLGWSPGFALQYSPVLNKSK